MNCGKRALLALSHICLLFAREIDSESVPRRSCSVSFVGPTGVRHSVEVQLNRSTGQRFSACRCSDGKGGRPDCTGHAVGDSGESAGHVAQRDGGAVAAVV